jgi:general secretion pathway protein F
MPVFTYRATDAATAADQRGTIAAETPRQARDLLRGRGLIVRDLGEAAGGGRAEGRPADPSRRRWGRRDSAGRPGGAATAAAAPTAEPIARPPARPSRRGAGRLRPHVTAFVRELATLLGVGVPLLDALDALSRQGTGRFRTVVLTLRERVAGGFGLAAAMREQPAAFDELAVIVVEVGEDAGTLDASLDRLADFRERADQLRGRVGTALIYPAIVLTMAVASSTFLMTFVVPRILEPLIEQGQPLPLPTRVVKGTSDFLLEWWWLLLAAAVAVAAAAGWAVRTPRGRRAWHTLILGLPIVGPMVRKQAVVRVAVVLSTLLRGGVVFLRAIQIARRSVSNVVLADALGRCERAVAAGGDIAAALDQTKAFPPAVVQVFAVGQEAGRLEDVLDRLAAAYDQQVHAAAQRLTAVLEPVLIVVLAAVVLFIVLATVLPILEAGNAIG